MDTSPAAHAMQLQLYRKAGPEGRAQIAAELSEIIRDLSRAGVRMRNPAFTEAEVTREVHRIFTAIAGTADMGAEDLFLKLRDALDAACIPYMVTGRGRHGGVGKVYSYDRPNLRPGECLALLRLRSLSSSSDPQRIQNGISSSSSGSNGRWRSSASSASSATFCSGRGAITRSRCAT